MKEYNSVREAQPEVAQVEDIQVIKTNASIRHLKYLQECMKVEKQDTLLSSTFMVGHLHMTS